MYKVIFQIPSLMIKNPGYGYYDYQFDSMDKLNAFVSSKISELSLSEGDYSVDIQDITEEYNSKQEKNDKIKLGAEARIACQNVLDLIAGDNLYKNLTSEQITQMISTFSSIQSALQASRPSMAKYLISQVSPDGIIVSEQMKAACLELLEDY